MSAKRVLKSLGSLSTLSQEQLNARLADVQLTYIETAPTFRAIYHSSKRQASRLAEAFATALPDIQHHRQLFQFISTRPKPERATLLEGYRRVGQDRWIVTAISQLPAAQGRTLMRDFVLKDGRKKDRKALREVWLFVAEIGKQVPTRRIRED